MVCEVSTRQTRPTPLLSTFVLAKQMLCKAIYSPVPIRCQRRARVLPRLSLASSNYGRRFRTCGPRTGDGLAAAMRRSGTFLEANLAAVNFADARELLSNDVKALLVELKHALQRGGATVHTGGAQTSSQSSGLPNGTLSTAQTSHTPDPLPMARGIYNRYRWRLDADATDTPIARINELACNRRRIVALESVQLVMRNADDTLGLVELPIKHGEQAEPCALDSSNMTSTTRQRAIVDRGSGATMRESGALHARVSLVGNRIAVQLRADSAELVNELSSRTPELAAMLTDSGLQVERIVCLHGLPANDVTELRAATPLLDVRA